MALTDSQREKVFWAGNIDKLSDPVRSTRWRFIVNKDIFTATGIEPTNGDSFGKTIESQDDFTIHIVMVPRFLKSPLRMKVSSIWDLKSTIPFSRNSWLVRLT